MRRLRSISLRLCYQSQPLTSWVEDVLSLLAPAPLEVFQIYSSDTIANSPVIDNFCKALVTAHGERLIRFALNGIRIGLGATAAICKGCAKLEQLLIAVLSPTSLVRHSSVFD